MPQSHPQRRSRPRSGLRRAALIAAVTGLLVSGAGPALADDRPWATDPGQSTPPPGTTPAPTPGGPMQAALLQAKSSGQPVTVDTLTTQTSITVANPDGTLTQTTNIQPARVSKQGAWTGVDATLAKNPDGTYSPTATPSGVALSGGGTGPLATFTDPAGHSFAMTLPMSLPAPAVTGNAAQYTDVLPGVDLKATVTDQGAFHEVLIVRDATAAANPALKTLRLATSTSGLNVTTDQAGNITAVTPDGTPVFQAATPVMWDSSTAAPSTGNLAHTTAHTAVQRAAVPRAASDAPGTTPTAPLPGGVDPAGVPTSSADGPGQNARIAAVAVHSDATSVTLTPDAGLLGGGSTTWPLYIDPSVSPVSTGTNHYTEVQQGCVPLDVNSTLYDKAQTNGEGIGYQHYAGDCYGLYRSFYEIDTSSLTSNMVISNATIYFSETAGANWDCNATAPVTLTHTGGIGQGTTWANMPGPTKELQNPVLGTQSPTSAGPNGTCQYQSVNFDITADVQKFAGNHPNLTFQLSGDESQSDTNYGFMRFGTNPALITKFDIPPKTPSALNTSPKSQNPSDPACGSGTPGWIGRTTSTGNASNINLNALLITDMNGFNLSAGFHVWDNMANDTTGHPKTVAWPGSGWAASGSTVSANIGFPVSDGHTYGWNAWATDGTLNSPNSPNCYFSVDLTPPAPATIANSTAFPPLGSGIPVTGHAGDAASITVTTTDPVPPAGSCTLASCLSSGVAKFEYSLDQNIPVQGALSTPATTTNGVATATIPITVGPDHWGDHTLYVRAVDKAGNSQATVATYSFYAPWNSSLKVTPGDLTGDGIPDLLATTTDGNLSLIPGNGAAVPTIASTPATSPTPNTGWDKFLIAHHGSLTQASVDDLFAFNTISKTMYTYKNDSNGTTPGTPGHFTHTQNISTAIPRPTCASTPSSSCAGYNSADWSGVSQIIAPGPPAADLITVENGRLWYYTSGGDAAHFSNAFPISTGDWSNATLMAPGNTVDRAYTLWARDNITGAVLSYPLTFDTNGNPTSTLAAPTHTPLVSGIQDTKGANLCLDIKNATTSNGTPAQVWSCNSSDAQNATLGLDNTVHILGKCLDIVNGGLNHGTPVQLWDCNNTGSQQWTPGDSPGSLKNPQSGMCLADPGSSQAPGTQLITWECGTGHPEQNWAYTTAGYALPAPQSLLPLGINSHDYRGIASPGDVHNNGLPSLYTTSSSGQISEYPGAPASAPAAVARLRLTDTTNTANPQQNNLTLSGTAAFTTDATRGAVLSLDGTAASASTTGPVLDTSTSYTVSAWVKPGDLTTTGVVASQSGTNGSGFQLYYSAGAHAWAFGRSNADDTSNTFSAVYGQTSGPNSPQLGKWAHLTGEYDATAQQLTLYVNGTIASTAPYSGTTWNATGHVQIGGRVLVGGTFGQYVKASISDVTMWGSVLTPAAITQTYIGAAKFGAPVTVGYVEQPADSWKLNGDGYDGSEANNTTKVHTLTVNGSSFTSDSSLNRQVLTLNGSTDYAATSGPIINTGKSYSISAWANLANTNGFATVVGQSGNTASAFYLQYSKSLNAWAFVSPAADSTSPGSYAVAASSAAAVTKKWTHLVGVYDATAQTMSLYVDGALTATTSNTSPWAATGPLTIGTAKNAGNNFPGSISDVQYFDSALTPAAVSLIGSQPATTQLS
ncbi:hypothetical protein GCM10009760_16470 [Kitasatospora kazusensis]|uniref:Ricin-type beta-trefoil lectin protein n=1 Tax=Kitasatospora kazusensis TaxID=407974 RepID=A0ABN2Z4U7_9ACTN